MTNCTCPAYAFPHRPLTGKCDGKALKQKVFEDGLACYAYQCSYLRQRSEKDLLSGRGTVTMHMCECLGTPSTCPGIAEIISNSKRNSRRKSRPKTNV